MLLIMFLMYTTAHSSIRKQCFEAFWYTHHLVCGLLPVQQARADIQAFFFMLALYTHATGCFVRDSVDPDYIPTFPFYSTEHCLGYLSWRFIIWPGIIVRPIPLAFLAWPLRLCVRQLIFSTLARGSTVKSERHAPRRYSGYCTILATSWRSASRSRV